MKDNDFLYVQTVAELQSFSKAAQQLYLAQPALSRYIRKLETELGVDLFDRHTSPVALTVAGERYLEYASIITDLLKKMEYDLNGIKNSISGKLKGGVPVLIGDYILPRFLPPFLASNSTIQIETIMDYSFTLNDSLQKHKLDFIITCVPIDNPQFSMERIAKDPILLMVRRDHPALAPFDTENASLENPLHVPLSAFQDHCFIKVQPNMTLYHITEGLFAENNFVPFSTMTAPTIQFSLELAVLGVGVAFVMQSLIKYGRYEFVEQLCPVCVSDTEIPVYLIYNKESCLNNPALNTFVSHVKSVWRSCEI